MKTYIKKLPLVLAAALLISLGTSCSTLRGFGRDVEDAGNSIQNVGN